MSIPKLKSIFVTGAFINDAKHFFTKINELISYQKPTILIDGSIVNWDISKAYNAKLILTANRTLKLIGLHEGDYGTLEVIQGGIGSYTLTLPNNSKVGSGGTGIIILSTAISSIDIVSFYYNGSTLYWNITKNFT